MEVPELVRYDHIFIYCLVRCPVLVMELQANCSLLIDVPGKAALSGSALACLGPVGHWGARSPHAPAGPDGAPTQQLLKSRVLTEAGSRAFSLFSADTPVLSVGLVSASSFLRRVVRNSERNTVALIKEKKEMADNAGNFL